MEILFPSFEGPEKKLEIILSAPRPEIRPNGDRRWDRVVRASQAEVIGRADTRALDAYLLSESSLFVWEDRILMITCGQTTLVKALPEIIRIVGRENIAFVFYEQKNFMFPHKQPSSFERDVSELAELFPGKYYTLGPANYDHVNVFYSSHIADMPERDATLQILMHDADPEAMALFCAENGGTPEQVEKKSGLSALYDREMVMDSHLFSPCGYSLNAITGDQYFTVHVTPQAVGSYVSFETNIAEPDYSDTIDRILSIFRPGRFSLVLTTSMDDATRASRKTVIGPLPGYDIADKSLYEFDCGYGSVFLNFTREQAADC
ncbi:adenosylmethionine decarboxylase [Desulfonema ishimotonii]|uniref:adenosylmethionine decarboxylase n=1 Tax=Desulfonema ishimotonii TaxID=45657 RepID=A0A401FWD8_9BACT|nr:adenosylmethionine decarboxylase [Desulfonema ishimotonii]GBC61302.1 adenosylmethionine decarboxylase [Desulfonema ishimotonii]